MTGSVVGPGDAGASVSVGEGLGRVADATAAGDSSGDAPPATRPDDGVVWSEGFPPIAEPRATIPINPITPTVTIADHVTVRVAFLDVLTDVPYVAVPVVGAVAQQLLVGHDGLEIVADGHRGREGCVERLEHLRFEGGGYFTAPATSPRTKKRCPKRKSSSIGSAAMKVPAMTNGSLIEK